MAQRADSSRPAKRVRDGYVPEDEQPRYVSPRPQRYLGSVINFSHGFGFIKPDDLGPNVFLHCTEIIGTVSLDNGDIVEFERQPPKPGDKADRALNVRLAGVQGALGSSSSGSGGGDISSCGSFSATATASDCATDEPIGEASSSSSSKRLTTLPRAAGGGGKGLVPRSVAARGVKAKARPQSDKGAHGEDDAAEAARRAAARRARPAEAAVLGWM